MRSSWVVLLSAVLLSATLVLTVNSAALAFRGSTPAEGMDRKLRHIEQNGALAHPDPTPTEFTEQEVNAYFAAGRVKLPTGVQSVHFESEPEVVSANCRVDFDQLKAGRTSSNPLLRVFSGVHDVNIVAHAHGAGHRGYVQVDRVALDGVQIPNFVLQLFVDKYLEPRYPGIGLNSQFALPNKIDTAIVGRHKLTVTQK